MTRRPNSRKHGVQASQKGTLMAQKAYGITLVDPPKDVTPESIAFAAGRKAFNDGLTKSKNPYPNFPDATLYDAWDRGWLMEEYEAKVRKHIR